MGTIRLRIREPAAEKGWTIKEVSIVPVSYTALSELTCTIAWVTMADFTSLQKLARTFDVMVEDLLTIKEK